MMFTGLTSRLRSRTGPPYCSPTARANTFVEDMAADGFASLSRSDVGMHVAFLRRGLPTLPDDQRDVHAAGLILAFVVDELEAELARLQAEGVTITMPLTAEEWGERAFQVRDPNGIIVQFG